MKTITTVGKNLASPRKLQPAMPEWPTALRAEAYHGVLGDLVRAVGPETEGDPAGILFSLLTMVGNAMGRHVRYPVGAGRHFPNLYVGIVGATAKGRKGVGLEVGRLVLRDLDPEWASRQASGLTSGEGLIHAVRDAVTMQKPVKAGGVITGYATVVADVGVADKRLLVVETELASVLRRMQREGNTLSALLRDAWDGRTLRSMGKGSPEQATEPHVSLVAHITRDELRRYLDTTEVANGLANRVLWCCVRRQRELPDGGQLPDLSVVQDQLRDALAWARDCPGELQRDAEAHEAWAKVYSRLTQDRAGLLGMATGRAEAQVVRIAMIYAALDRSAVVRRVHLRAALAVWRYAADSAAHIFGDSLGDPIADGILDHLKACAPASVSRTEISTALGRNVPALEISRALQLLADHGRVNVESSRTEGRGRPTEFITFLENNELDELNVNPNESCLFRGDGATGENERSGTDPGISSNSSACDNTPKPARTQRKPIHSSNSSISTHANLPVGEGAPAEDDVLVL